MAALSSDDLLFEEKPLHTPALDELVDGEFTTVAVYPVLLSVELKVIQLILTFDSLSLSTTSPDRWIETKLSGSGRDCG